MASLRSAYLVVTLLWATTPLAVQWSSVGTGVMFSITARMLLGLLCVAVLLYAVRQPLPRHRDALATYAASSLGIFGALMLVYYSAQRIPSGWISVMFGLSPLATALMAAVLLRGHRLTVMAVLAQLVGAAGLAVIFASAISLGPGVLVGLVAALGGTFVHAFSAVWVKRINAGLAPLAVTGGGLMFALPAFAVSFLISGAGLPEAITAKSALATIYLGVLATAGGFSLYYYVLKHTSAVNVSMMALISPVLALALGNALNNEVLTPRFIAGAAMILSALAMHEIVPRLARPRVAAVAEAEN